MSCNSHVPSPTGSISVAIHNHLPFGAAGGILGVGSWSFGYFYSTGLTANYLSERTETVILATLTVSSGDLGSLGNCVLIDISGSIPGSVDPYINGCYLVVVNNGTGQEAVFAGWPSTFDGVHPANACGAGGGAYPGIGQPYGAWSYSDFNPNPLTSWVPLVTVNTTIRPDVFTPPPDPPPSIPLVACAPAATLLTSPAKSSGCNPGGTTWEIR